MHRSVRGTIRLPGQHHGGAEAAESSEPLPDLVPRAGGPEARASGACYPDPPWRTRASTIFVAGCSASPGRASSPSSPRSCARTGICRRPSGWLAAAWPCTRTIRRRGSPWGEPSSSPATSRGPAASSRACCGGARQHPREPHAGGVPGGPRRPRGGASSVPGCAASQPGRPPDRGPDSRSRAEAGRPGSSPARDASPERSPGDHPDRARAAAGTFGQGGGQRRNRPQASSGGRIGGARPTSPGGARAHRPGRADTFPRADADPGPTGEFVAATGDASGPPPAMPKVGVAAPPPRDPIPPMPGDFDDVFEVAPSWQSANPSGSLEEGGPILLLEDEAPTLPGASFGRPAPLDTPAEAPRSADRQETAAFPAVAPPGAPITLTLDKPAPQASPPSEFASFQFPLRPARLRARPCGERPDSRGRLGVCSGAPQPRSTPGGAGGPCPGRVRHSGIHSADHRRNHARASVRNPGRALSRAGFHGQGGRGVRAASGERSVRRARAVSSHRDQEAGRHDGRRDRRGRGGGPVDGGEEAPPPAAPRPPSSTTPTLRGAAPWSARSRGSRRCSSR